jgi:hypothetical protein
MKAAASECFKAIGQHNKDLSDALAEQPNDCLNVLLALVMEESVSDDAKDKARSALKKLISKTQLVQPLTDMLINAEGNRIVKYILQQLEQILRDSHENMETFRKSNGLKIVNRIADDKSDDDKAGERASADTIRQLYPPNI